MGNCRLPFSIVIVFWALFGLSTNAQDILPSLPLFAENLPTPVLRSGIGTSNLEISTQSSEAQAFFNQGVTLLHGYDWLQALLSFWYSAKLDPTAVMPMWGVNRAIENGGLTEFKTQQEYAVGRMREALGSLAGREFRYVNGAVLRDSLGGLEGKKAEIRELELLLHEFPNEVDSKLFLAKELGWRYNSSGQPLEGTIYALTILEGLLESHPNHAGVHHYWIHAVELFSPERALESAKSLSRLAPQMGHLVHMAGHLYFSLGRYQEANESFDEARLVSEQNRQKLGFDFIDDPMEIHNLYFLVTSLAETGEVEKARYWANTLREIEISVSRRSSSGMFAVFYQGQMSLGKLELRFGNWDQAVRAFKRIDAGTDLWEPGVSATQAYRDVLLLFAEGMAATNEGDIRLAKEKLAALDAALWVGNRDGGLTVFGGFLLRHLAPTSYELKGSILYAEGKKDAAIKALKAAVTEEEKIGKTEPPYYSRPSREHLGEVLFKENRIEEAREVYLELLSQRPNNAFGWLGIAKTNEASGNVSEAIEAYTSFLEVYSKADIRNNEIDHARKFIFDHQQ